MAIKVVTATAQPRQRRRIRRPQHTFNVSARPFEICPFFIAPVLPGETMDNLLMQSFAVSDPVANPLIGWWKEYYFFYVPHRALEDLVTGYFTGNEVTEMHLDAAAPITSLVGANSVTKYAFNEGVDWVDACLTAVVGNFFRDEDDIGTMTALVDYPAAYVDQRHWAHSLKLESATGDDEDIPGQDAVEDLDVLAGYTTARDQWEIMRDSGTEDVTYEDYLRAQGVAVKGDSNIQSAGEIHYKPELIRFCRKWSKPTSHIDPADGSPTSAMVWNVAERADKARFFKEPGFLFGVTIARPKLYMASQKGAAVGLMSQADYWLPKVLQGYPYASVKEALDSATEGILQNLTEDYWFDIKDLFLYGDQFVNRAMSATANHGIALPTATLDKRYVTAAMAKSFFVDTVTNNFVKEDGVVHLNIRSTIGPDTTP